MVDEIRPAGVGVKLRTSTRHPLRWLVSGLFVLVFAVFGGVVWMALSEVRSVNREPLVVRAPSGPIKQAPEERGGLAVLNQNSPLVRSLANIGDRPGPERILPPEETPPQSAAQALPVELALADETMRAEAVQKAGTDPAPAAGPDSSGASGRVPPVEALQSAEPATPVIAQRSQQDANEPQEQAVAALAPPSLQPGTVSRGTTSTAVLLSPQPLSLEASPPVEFSSSTDNGDYRLQLLALTDVSAVHEAWTKYQDRFEPLLNNVGASVVGVDTSKGRLYRLQVGPYNGRQDALTACEQIQSRGGDCFVVGPIS